MYKRKFDFRLYVVVTSFEPLEAFIYNEGFARYAMRPYRTDPESLNDPFIHLTNSSIGQGFDKGTDSGGGNGGGGGDSEPDDDENDDDDEEVASPTAKRSAASGAKSLAGRRPGASANASASGPTSVERGLAFIERASGMQLNAARPRAAASTGATPAEIASGSAGAGAGAGAGAAAGDPMSSAFSASVLATAAAKSPAAVHTVSDLTTNVLGATVVGSRTLLLQLAAQRQDAGIAHLQATASNSNTSSNSAAGASAAAAAVAEGEWDGEFFAPPPPPPPTTAEIAAFEQEGGSKQLLSDCLADLAALGVDTDAVMRSIDNVVIRTLMCVKNKIGPQPNCFELFGFDVMLDSKLKPWVIEANASPSLNLNTSIDRAVKPQLLADILTMVDPLPFDRAYLAHMLAARAREGAWPVPPGLSPDASYDERLNAHFHRLLRGRVPRLFGQMPARLGAFRRLAPGGPGSVYGDMAKFRNLISRVRFSLPNAKLSQQTLPTTLVPVTTVQPVSGGAGSSSNNNANASANASVGSSGGGVSVTTYVRRTAKKTEYSTGNLHRDTLPGLA